MKSNQVGEQLSLLGVMCAPKETGKSRKQTGLSASAEIRQNPVGKKLTEQTRKLT